MIKKSGFLVIWAGQAFSLLGSEMTSFALGIWLYQRTGLASNFAFVALCAVLPQMLLSPLAGIMIDRINRRKLMALADCGAALCTLVMVFLFFTDRIEVWHIFLMTILSASCVALQAPAYSALVAGSIERSNLGRANGLLQFGQALSQILAPAIAGVLVVAIGVAGVLFVDLFTFLAAVSSLLISRLPADPPARVSVTGEPTPGLIRQWLEGWKVLQVTPELTRLMRFQSIFTFLWSVFAVMVTPMVLGFSGSDGLGLLLTIAGSGLLCGSLVMTAWGGPRKRQSGLLVFELLSAVAFVCMGLRPNLVLVAAGAFGAHFTLAFVSSLNDSLWQEQTPSEVLGRVFSLRQMVMRGATLVAYLLAGVVLDRSIEPLLLPGGSLADTIGLFFGVGVGRGIAFVCSMIGLVKMITVLVLVAPYRGGRNNRNEHFIKER